MAEIKLVFIATEHKPHHAAFYCPFCGEGVYTIESTGELKENTEWNGITEQCWSNVRCNFCETRFDLYRTVYNSTPPHYTGSLVIYGPSDDSVEKW